MNASMSPRFQAFCCASSTARISDFGSAANDVDPRNARARITNRNDLFVISSEVEISLTISVVARCNRQTIFRDFLHFGRNDSRHYGVGVGVGVAVGVGLKNGVGVGVGVVAGVEVGNGVGVSDLAESGTSLVRTVVPMIAADVAVAVGVGVAVLLDTEAGVGVGAGSASCRYVITHVALGSGQVTLICAGPSTTTCLINSGDDVGSISEAVSTALGGGVGVGVGVTVGVDVGVGVAVGVGVGHGVDVHGEGEQVGVQVGVDVGVGVAVGVAAAAITTPRVVPPP
jgi:hypothetical protein